MVKRRAFWHDHTSETYMVAPALVVAVVFCFGLVLFQAGSTVTSTRPIAEPELPVLSQTDAAASPPAQTKSTSTDTTPTTPALPTQRQTETLSPPVVPPKPSTYQQGPAARASLPAVQPAGPNLQVAGPNTAPPTADILPRATKPLTSLQQDGNAGRQNSQ